MAKEMLDLTGNWEFRQYPASARRMRDLDDSHWSRTRVPASVFQSLVADGQIDRKELLANPEKFAWVSDKPWIFRKRFDLPADLADCGRLELVFDGLDTVASIWLNDKLIAKTANMFIPFRFDVTDFLRPKANQLLVKFEPACAYAKALMARYTSFDQSAILNPHRAYVRKAQYQFGWDWCPALPGCGIWRPVRLEGVKKARFDDVHIRAIDSNRHYADVKISVKLAALNSDHFTCTLQLKGRNFAAQQELAFLPGEDFHSTVLRIEKPDLWWPAGSGEQNLYHADLQLHNTGDLLDRRCTHFGIRTVKLNQSPDSCGRAFAFEVNGQTVFAKGANWIPPSLFPGSVTDDDYEKLLNAAADANMNMLRVWGGGYYEADRFYEICDRLGIMVWQDFMFACTYYPDRQWFISEVRKEAATVIKRLRNHPSLVLWCGNNEIDFSHHQGYLGKGRKFYGKAIYHNLLPKLLHELDPDRDYIPTTPLGTKNDSNSPNCGTVHQWDVWAFHAPSREYICPPDQVPRFVAEFGFQSLPDIKTLKDICSIRQLRIADYAVEKHNYQLDGNCRLRRYISELFAGPADLEELIYLSQLTQARALKKYVEYLRANNIRNKGVLFWQFNDCCPAISWSALDYAKRPKALYYYAKRCFSNVLVTLVPEFHPPKANFTPTVSSLRPVVVNDSNQPVTATLTCRLIDLFGNSLDKLAFPVAIGPSNSSSAPKLPAAFLNPVNPDKSALRITLEENNRTIAHNLYFYLPDKYIQWPKPNITADVRQRAENRWQIRLKSDSLARDVQIIAEANSQFSDNFIDLTPPGDVVITLTTTKPHPSIKPALRLRSVTSTSR